MMRWTAWHRLGGGLPKWVFAVLPFLFHFAWAILQIVVMPDMTHSSATLE